MRALDRKLARDLWRLRGQVLAIALVVASGVAVMIMSLSSLEALEETTAAYYDRYRFADVFATLKRAPEPLARRIADLPGVQNVETRIVKLATLDIAGFPEPATARLVSIPERGTPVLNRLALRSGRSVAPGRPDEAVLSEPFAEAHGLAPGDELKAIINGHRRSLRVVGVALSPEFVYSIGPGALMPDDLRFGTIWMGREALAAAYDLDGAFNDVALSLLRGVDPASVLDRLDRLLASSGGTGAIARADQISNWFLMNELAQLETLASILPTIFLAVAAFLANMVLARLIAMERGEIGLLKAFGYGKLEIGWHYVKLALAIAGLGVVIGWVLGAWLGRWNTQVFAQNYDFPFLFFRPGPAPFVTGAVFGAAAVVLGALGAVRKAVALPPAEAMHPPAPPRFRQSRIGAALMRRLFDQPSRMILRQILRSPVRSLLTVTGLALAVAVLLSTLYWLDSINRIVEVHFLEAQRQDVTVGLVEARSSRALHGFRALPGVRAAEPERSLSTVLRAGQRSKRVAVQGVLPEAHLQLVLDTAEEIVRVPPEGLLLSATLAAILDVGAGDLVTVEVLEGRRPVVELPVTAVFETYIGTPAYMHLDALNRLMRERPSVNTVHLLTDTRQETALFAELKALPQVATVTLRRAAADIFRETVAETVVVFVMFFAAFACTLTFGVVYNSTRIALSERGRELATLRVLGFGRMEISYILLGETALLVICALPLGSLLGYGLAWFMSGLYENELYRLPLVLEPATYGLAALICLAAALVCAVVVRRRLDRLDLIAVLKTRE